MSSLATAPSRPRLRPRSPAARVGEAARRIGPDFGLGLTLGGALCALAFLTTGGTTDGTNLGPNTWAQIALVLIAAGLGIAAVRVCASGRAWGATSLGLFAALAALTLLSISWSVQPANSWLDTNLTLSYLAAFAGGLALARIAPERWAAIIGAVVLLTVVVSGYALLAKVFPATLNPDQTVARLSAPFGYWNAVGLTAAMGAICCLWLGARRTGHALARALAYPAMGLLLLTLVLAYSRGALAALAVGLALWFCTVPLRLRGAALLIVGALGAGAVAAWDFSRHALSSEGVALAQRDAAGHQLGAVIVAMLAMLAILGIAIGFFTARRAPSLLARRRAGAALLAAILLVIIAFAGALAHSHRGLLGSISHTISALTNPNAKPPPNTPGRLTAVASVRARYWKEGLQVFDAHPLVGAGAEGYATAHLRYETGTLEVRHAHSFIVQTLADLGLLGLLVALALLLTWIAAAWRTCRSPRRYTPERVAMLSMLSLVVVFGAHSTIDWTWYVPGDACVALLCAGWLAGRGPLLASAGVPAPTAEKLAPPSAATAGSWWRPRLRARPSYTRIALATAAILAALLAAWSQWQPQRSEEASLQADSRLEAHDSRAALADADAAVARDPLSIEALFTLASVERVSGEPARARATLERAVRLQPSNPQAWLVLGRYDLQSSPSDPRAAVKELRAAIYLNPESISPEAIAAGDREAIEIHNDYIQALRTVAQQESAPGAGGVNSAGGGNSAGGSLARAKRAAPTAGRRRSAPRSP